MSLLPRRPSFRQFLSLRSQGGPVRPRGLLLEELEARELMDAGIASLGRHWLSAGLQTFGQVVPRGEAYSGLRIGSFATQNDIKTRWDDGSIRFAIVTATVNQNGYYQLSDAAPATGTFTPTVPDASVRFTIGALQYAATLPTNFASYDMWLNGPQVREGRQVVTPLRTDNNQPHPYLRVYMDFRAYLAGENRLDVAVENTLNSAGDAVTYNVSIIVNGQTQFQRNSVNHSYLTRWRQVVTANNPSAGSIYPDFEPVYGAAALPRYLPIVTNQVLAPTGPNFQILGAGSLQPYMPSHSGRPELAPYPDWAARYLVHNNATQRAYVLAHGDLSGSWPIHVRENNGQLVSIDQRPNYWLDPRALPNNRPAGNLGARGPLVPDIAHQPSIAYIPYLLTGDRYYADEMAMWANYVLIATWQDTEYNARGGSQGLLHSNEVRGIAWGLRNIVDAAAYLPDGQVVKSYLIDKIYNNLVWLDQYAATDYNPLYFLWERKRPENSTPGYNNRAWVGLWEQDYLVWAIDHANWQGYYGGLYHAYRIGLVHLSLFVYPYTRNGAAPYIMPVGDQVPSGSGNIRYYTTYDQLYYGPTQYPGYYGPEARLVALIGITYNQMNVPGFQWYGAEFTYSFLHPKLAVEIFDQGVPDLAVRAGWAIAQNGWAGPERNPGATDLNPVAAPATALNTGWFVVQGLAAPVAAPIGAATPAVGGASGDELRPLVEDPALVEPQPRSEVVVISDRRADHQTALWWENVTQFGWPTEAT